ncbi:hypothetical protein NPIL_659811 [Nephila pilipes]|uniref:Uncharacterized protein n=1 Tax=Nephila pilipes TaxID=299642 RepID=A0A8X6UDY2_NEPPI|nr:hypothetical protein NPIL_659811 [Nephila pilipes]
MTSRNANERKDRLDTTNFKTEIEDGYGNKKRSYANTSFDRKYRRFDYVVDARGFRTFFKTCEPTSTTTVPEVIFITSPYAEAVASGIDLIASSSLTYTAPIVSDISLVSYGCVIARKFQCPFIF